MITKQSTDQHSRRVTLGQVPVEFWDYASLTQFVVDCAKAGRGGLIITPNVSIARQMTDSALPAEIYDPLASPVDGSPLCTLVQLAGHGRPERVTGVDLMREVVNATRSEDISVAVIGAGARGFLDSMSDTSRRVPLAGGELPFADAVAPEMIKSAREVSGSSPQIVFVCLGFPKQELVALELRRYLPGTVFIGVGAAARMLSGDVVRAPALLQRLQMEWLWRLASEPKRLFRRYILQDLPWFARSATKIVLARRPRGVRGAAA